MDSWNADGSPSRAALSDRPVPARPSHPPTVAGLVADGFAAESDRGIGVHRGVGRGAQRSRGGQSPGSGEGAPFMAVRLPAVMAACCAPTEQRVALATQTAELQPPKGCAGSPLGT